MENFTKRRLQEESPSRYSWMKVEPGERIRAMQIINRLYEPEFAEQAFPRIHRVTRKKKD